MSNRQYWLDLFTGATWQEFLDAGGEISGFRERRWKIVQHIKPGDYLLCYLTGVSRWIGVLEVVSSPFKDTNPIWEDEAFPCRVRVRRVVALTPETAVPVLDLQEHLTIFQHLKSPLAWTGHFRGSPTKWKPADGEIVVQALLDAQQNPVVRPVSATKLARRPRALNARVGSVTVPEGENAPDDTLQTSEVPTAIPRSSGCSSNWVTTWALMCGWPAMTAVVGSQAMCLRSCPV